MRYMIVFLILLHVSLFASYISVCQQCHGKNFEQKALGKSKIVKNMSKQDIKQALIEFKTSTSIMKSYASRLNNKQIKQISNVFGK